MLIMIQTISIEDSYWNNDQRLERKFVEYKSHMILETGSNHKIEDIVSTSTEM